MEIFKNRNESSDSWRLLLTPPSPGDWNMALDVALMESAVENGSPPTLRLFSWDPPCLSLGYAQSVSEVDEQSLVKHGWTLVRRPTGGRAILHADELTYSITGRLEDPMFHGSILESYLRLSAALVSALSFLGVDADIKEIKDVPPQNSGSDAVCFEVASNYEITYRGKKLIGSAQARRNQGFLQHGSLPLIGDLNRINDVIQYSSDDVRNASKKRLLEHATTLESILGYRVSWEQAAEAMEKGFRKALGVDFFRSDLSDGEMEKSIKLKAEKYGNQDWIKRR
jgi:lipoate-protein ligase A